MNNTSSFAPTPIRPPTAPGALPVVSATLATFVGVTTLFAAFASASDAAQRAAVDDGSFDASAVVVDEEAPARRYCFGA